MKKIIKDYFTFSKKERVAITMLLLLIACFIAMPYFYLTKQKTPMVNRALVEYIEKNKNSNAAENNQESAATFYPTERREEEVVMKKENFPFNPNTITQEEWQRLGLTSKTARTIINYRNKGGKFRRAEDINKIWGIKKEDADRLVPLVRLETIPEQKNFAPKEIQTPQPAARKVIEPVDINTAGEDEWKTLPGIGDILAKRILKFREYAGGFTSVEQVGKTYGLADSVFQKILPFLKINTETLPKLNINLASAYELKRKLNIVDALAKAIIAHRKQNGLILSVQSLKNLPGISDTLYTRIAPLLKVE